MCNSIDGAGAGITLDASKNCSVSQNTITNAGAVGGSSAFCTAISGGYGIGLCAGSDLNSITDNEVGTLFSRGMVLLNAPSTPSESNLIQTNEIVGNRISGAANDGIWARNSQKIFLHDNTTENNGQRGLYVWQCSDWLIEDHLSKDNTLQGMVFEEVKR